MVERAGHRRSLPTKKEEDPVTAPVIPGAEPFSAGGGPDGVLVLHGFTGSPHSMKGLAKAFAAAGFTVECPLLPGHGTALEDMMPTRWADWSAAAEAAYQDLAARTDRRLVAGLSMGGTLTTWLATRHPEIVGLVCVNPQVEPLGPMRDMVQAGLDGGMEVMPGIGSEIALPDTQELAYPGTPLRPLLSLMDAVDELQPHLGSITCPVLLVNSVNDHVVFPSNAEHFVATVAGPVERMVLERSFHVATLDYDAADLEARAVEFALKVTAG
jgi:carboxylesterase